MRNKRITFRLSEEENNLINKKMNLLNIKDKSNYIRKMSIDGYIVNLDLENIKELIVYLRKSSENINQIARRINSTGNFYAQDLEDLQEYTKKTWCNVNKILTKLNKI